MITRTVSEEGGDRLLPSSKGGQIIKGTWKSDPDNVDYYMCVHLNNQRLWINLSSGRPMGDLVPCSSPVKFPAGFTYIGTSRGSVALGPAEEDDQC